jgi:hypothetical protein
MNSRFLRIILSVLAGLGIAKLYVAATPGLLGGAASSNKLILGAQSQVRGGMDIPLYQPFEIDGYTKAKVYALRSSTLRPYLGSLVAKDYKPFEAVFSQIEDGKPWWGIHGLYFYGPGAHGIDGPSEETRFLANPLLLVGIAETNAFTTKFTPSSPAGVFPAPSDLTFYPSQAQVKVHYDTSAYFAHLGRMRSNVGEKLGLIAYNARDFGYTHLKVDSTSSFGVQVATGTTDLKQFIHRGGSCGYPGGCNNMSPAQPTLEFTLKARSARIVLTLSRAKGFFSGPEIPPINYTIDIN